MHILPVVSTYFWEREALGTCAGTLRLPLPEREVGNETDVLDTHITSHVCSRVGRVPSSSSSWWVYLGGRGGSGLGRLLSGISFVPRYRFLCGVLGLWAEGPLGRRKRGRLETTLKHPQPG